MYFPPRFIRITKPCRPALICLSLLAVACSEPPPVKGVRAAFTRVESTVSPVNSGTVKAEQEAELAFGTVGRVSAVTALVGDRVKAGQVLAELENVDLKTALVNAEKDLERTERLSQSRILSEAEREASRRILDSARAAYEKSLIRAPFDGIVTEVNLDAGQLSQITAIMPRAPIRVVDVAPRYVEAELDEVDLPTVRKGMPARLKILAVRREPFLGSVRKVVPFVSTLREQDRTSLIELQLPPTPALLPVGASADVEIIVEEKEHVLAVPPRTVFGRGDDRYVFKLADDKALRTPVKVGLSNYERIEITSGLAEGDAVLYPPEKEDLKDGKAVKAEIAPWP